eukprot:598425-Pleurochrysis_carterae.AAC.2
MRQICPSTLLHLRALLARPIHVCSPACRETSSQLCLAKEVKAWQNEQTKRTSEARAWGAAPLFDRERRTELT